MKHGTTLRRRLKTIECQDLAGHSCGGQPRLRLPPGQIQVILALPVWQAWCRKQSQLARHLPMGFWQRAYWAKDLPAGGELPSEISLRNLQVRELHGGSRARGALECDFHCNLFTGLLNR